MLMTFFKKMVTQLGLPKVVAFSITTIAFCLFFGFLISQHFTSDMTLLFSQLDPIEAGRIIEKLKLSKTPFEVRGDYIYVSSRQVALLRMELAQEGLPANATSGYEIFDKNDFLGTTSGLMDITHVRAIEGELAKSIKTITSVSSARVHLVFPKRELFCNEKTQASASIIVQLKGGARLSPQQIQSILHLVASSVPSLNPEHISLVDHRGTLLSRGNHSKENDISSSQQNDLQIQRETRLAQTIESLLERFVGHHKVKAEVSAELDFDKVTSTSIEFSPSGQVIKNITTVEDAQNNTDSSAQEQISIQSALPIGGSTPLAQGGNSSKTNRNEETIAYENSKVNKTFVKEIGTIKRLSVAVVVDGNYQTINGQQEYIKRSPEELSELVELVKTTVGYKKERGDVVSVINRPFVSTESFEEASLLTPQKNHSHLLIGLMAWGVFAPLIVGFLWIRRRHFFLISDDKKSPPSLSKNLHSQDFNLSPSCQATETIHKTTPPSKQNCTTSHKKQEPTHKTEDKKDADKNITDIIKQHPEESFELLRCWIYSQKSDV